MLNELANYCVPDFNTVLFGSYLLKNYRYSSKIHIWIVKRFERRRFDSLSLALSLSLSLSLSQYI